MALPEWEPASVVFEPTPRQRRRKIDHAFVRSGLRELRGRDQSSWEVCAECGRDRRGHPRNRPVMRLVHGEHRSYVTEDRTAEVTAQFVEMFERDEEAAEWRRAERLAEWFGRR